MAFRKLPKPSAPAKDDLIALCLAQGLRQAEIAKKVGVTDRTIRNKLKRPEIQELITYHRDRMISEAHGTLAAYASDAIRVMVLLLKNEKPGVRLSAAKAIGELVIKVGQYQDLTKRIADIEAALKVKGRR